MTTTTAMSVSAVVTVPQLKTMRPRTKGPNWRSQQHPGWCLTIGSRNLFPTSDRLEKDTNVEYKAKLRMTNRQ